MHYQSIGNLNVMHRAFLLLKRCACLNSWSLLLSLLPSTVNYHWPAKSRMRAKQMRVPHYHHLLVNFFIWQFPCSRQHKQKKLGKGTTTPKLSFTWSWNVLAYLLNCLPALNLFSRDCEEFKSNLFNLPKLNRAFCVVPAAPVSHFLFPLFFVFSFVISFTLTDWSAEISAEIYYNKRVKGEKNFKVLLQYLLLVVVACLLPSSESSSLLLQSKTLSDWLAQSIRVQNGSY